MDWAIGIVVGGIVAVIAYVIATSLITGLEHEALILGLCALLLWIALALVIRREGWGRRGL